MAISLLECLSANLEDLVLVTKGLPPQIVIRNPGELKHLIIRLLEKFNYQMFASQDSEKQTTDCIRTLKEFMPDSTTILNRIVQAYNPDSPGISNQERLLCFKIRVICSEILANDCQKPPIIEDNHNNIPENFNSQKTTNQSNKNNIEKRNQREFVERLNYFIDNIKKVQDKHKYSPFLLEEAKYSLVLLEEAKYSLLEELFSWIAFQAKLISNSADDDLTIRNTIITIKNNSCYYKPRHVKPQCFQEIISEWEKKIVFFPATEQSQLNNNIINADSDSSIYQQNTNKKKLP